MPTEKPRVTITIDEQTLTQIDNFKFENRCKNQTQAILELVNRGLAVIMDELKSDEKKEPSNQIGQTVQEEHPLMQFFDELNPTGQETLLDYAETLTFNPKYKKRDTFSKEA